METSDEVEQIEEIEVLKYENLLNIGRFFVLTEVSEKNKKLIIQHLENNNCS
jgi:hypothetical protein